jgi:hypothetical protein
LNEVCAARGLLLQSRHHWLLTVAAKGVMRLLQPLQYHHVYIPVMPYSLTDYLEVSCAAQLSFLQAPLCASSITNLRHRITTFTA